MDSDANPTSGMTTCVTLSTGETNLTVDAGLFVPPQCLAVIKTANQSFISPGGRVVYSYIVSNSSEGVVTGIVVTDDNGTPGFPADDFVVGTVGSLAPHTVATFTVTNSPPVPMCMTVNGTNMVIGSLTTQILPNGDVKATYLQSRSVVDNTYGSGAVGWPGGHTFSQLLGSDKAQFVFYNGAGTKVLDAYVDYISAASTSVYPSGYGTLGVTGGDGAVNFGSASNVVSVMTTITRSLNQSPAFYGYTVNSPLPESSFPTWEYVDGYDGVIKGSAFGASGFGRVEIPLVHNSPSKLGFNAQTPSPCSSCVTNTAVAIGQGSGTTVSASDTEVVCLTTNRASALGDFVWNDLNGNGVQDAGEPGVAGARVHFYDCAGSVLASPTTDGSGKYLFVNLAGGSYKVKFIPPPNYAFTLADATSDDKDSDANPVSGLTACVTLGLAETNRTVDAGLTLPPSCVVLIKEVNQPFVTPGGQVIYTYIVSNMSSMTVTGITVTDDNGTPGFPGDDFVVGTVASLSPTATATFMVTNSPPMPMCMTVNGTNMVIGTLVTKILPNGDVKATYLQSRNVVDNTYGTGAVGWPGNNHTFNQLLGSDKAQFVFYNGAGTKILDFDVDYISASAAYPSGYGTLGVAGGDGGMNFGSASNVVSTVTTISRTLNQSPAFYGYTVNSPLPES